MPYTPIMTVLAYVLSEDRRQVLLCHRTKRENDEHAGKYNGLGGKLEPGENIIQCLRRELREEAAIECREIVLRGTVSWPGFGSQGEDWFAFVFRVDRFTGTPFTENDEGRLEWVKIDCIMDLPMWEGDRHFLPLVFAEDQGPFHGVMPYEGGRPIRWDYDVL